MLTAQPPHPALRAVGGGPTPGRGIPSAPLASGLSRRQGSSSAFPGAAGCAVRRGFASRCLGVLGPSGGSGCFWGLPALCGEGVWGRGALGVRPVVQPRPVACTALCGGGFSVPAAPGALVKQRSSAAGRGRARYVSLPQPRSPGSAPRSEARGGEANQNNVQKARGTPCFCAHRHCLNPHYVCK